MNNHPHHISLVAALAATFLVACSADSGSRTESARGDSARADSAAAPAVAAGAAGVNVDANSTPPKSSDSSHFDGVPPLRIGMSEADARQALGMPASSSKPSATARDECRYLDTKGRSRVYAMLVRDTVVRLDVRDSTLATDAGARVGDPEPRVLSLYAGRVTTQPHKYVNGGHYLIVKSPADSSRALVFETDGKRVTSWRVGQVPQVEWVEGCS